MSKQQEHLTISEYARRKGVSHTAVFRAIESGRIVKGLVIQANGRKGIIEAVADAEWTANTNSDHHFSRYRTKGGSNATQVDTEETKAQSQSSLQAAKRAKAIFDAKLAELDYKKKSGVLVEREKVYKALYQFGQALRNELQSIPERIIDELLATDNRNEALTKLYDEIAASLDKMTKYESAEFS